jgi:hypothetical protein
MFHRSALIMGLCLTIASLNTVAEARTVTNGVRLNGTSFNGLSFNGVSSNRTSFNGLSFNGLAMNGTRSIQSTGTTAALEGVPVQQISLEGSQLMLHLQRSTR